MAEQLDICSKESWVAELFPATFSIKDLMGENKPLDIISNDSCDLYSKIYKKVLLAEREKEGDISHLERPECSVLFCKESPQELSNKNTWTAEDISAFVSSYKRLKKRAVKLICIVETKSLKCKQLKSKLEEANKSKEKVLADRTQLLRTNSQLKVAKESLEVAVGELEKKTVLLGSQISYLTAQSNDLKKMLFCARQETVKKVQSIYSLQKQLCLCQEQLKKEVSMNVEQISLKYQSEIERLEEQVQHLSNELSIYKNKFDLAQESAKSLQSHLANVNVWRGVSAGSENHRPDFIDVVDFT